MMHQLHSKRHILEGLSRTSAVYDNLSIRLSMDIRLLELVHNN